MVVDVLFYYRDNNNEKHSNSIDSSMHTTSYMFHVNIFQPTHTHTLTPPTSIHHRPTHPKIPPPPPQVMTGFRIAKGCAQEYFGITPDVTTMGKVIGGGLPVGAYGGRKDIMMTVAPAGPMYQVWVYVCV